LPAVLQRLIGRFRPEEDPQKKMENAIKDMLKEQKRKREALARMKSTQDRVREQFREAQQSVAEWHRRAVVAGKDSDRRRVERAEAQRDIANGMTDRLQEQIVEVEQNMEAMAASLLTLGFKIQAAREEHHHLIIQRKQSPEESNNVHRKEAANSNMHIQEVANHNVHRKEAANDDLHRSEVANSNVHRSELANNINLHRKDVQRGTAEGHLEEIEARLLDAK